MTDEISELKNKIASLENELAEAKNDTSFDDLKQKYEKIIEEKNEEINTLEQTVEETKKQVDATVNNLKDEVQAKLEANEKLIQMQKDIEELVRDKAEATVDTFIQQGKILPAQRETALKLCLNDNDTFMELYRNSQPIIDLKPRTKKVNADLSRLVFKTNVLKGIIQNFSKYPYQF